MKWFGFCQIVVNVCLIFGLARAHHNLGVLHERVRSLEDDRDSRNFFPNEERERRDVEVIIEFWKKFNQDVIKERPKRVLNGPLA